MLTSLARAVATAVRLSTATTSTARALPLSSPALCAPRPATIRPPTRSLCAPRPATIRPPTRSLCAPSPATIRPPTRSLCAPSPATIRPPTRSLCAPSPATIPPPTRSLCAPSPATIPPLTRSLCAPRPATIRPPTRSLCAPSPATIRPLTRSLWMHHNGAASGCRQKLFSSTVLRLSGSCGCGGLHTEGDKAFGDFLSDEIKEEKKIQKNQTLPKMSAGWELELNGTEAKLTRFTSGDKVTVTFNVNNSIPPTLEEESEQGQQKAAEDEPEILSTPNFVVEVTKQSAKHSLVFDCHYPEDETSHGEREESDIFAIREVSFQPEGDSDWKETSYTLNTDSLDWALYDHLMDFLADRGVDNTFADELIELSTGREHQEYIKFLEDLGGFVKCN